MNTLIAIGAGIAVVTGIGAEHGTRSFGDRARIPSPCDGNSACVSADGIAFLLPAPTAYSIILTAKHS